MFTTCLRGSRRGRTVVQPPFLGRCFHDRHAFRGSAASSCVAPASLATPNRASGAAYPTKTPAAVAQRRGARGRPAALGRQPYPQTRRRAAHRVGRSTFAVLTNTTVAIARLRLVRIDQIVAPARGWRQRRTSDPAGRPPTWAVLGTRRGGSNAWRRQPLHAGARRARPRRGLWPHVLEGRRHVRLARGGIEPGERVVVAGNRARTSSDRASGARADSP
jgi:hypothetical protein